MACRIRVSVQLLKHSRRKINSSLSSCPLSGSIFQIEIDQVHSKTQISAYREAILHHKGPSAKLVGIPNSMPASQTLAHLRRRFNPIASMLLSAESLSDMSERKELCKSAEYCLLHRNLLRFSSCLDTEFMAWLEVMSSHENLAGLMGQVSHQASSCAEVC